jgi:hypothetical protein
MGNCEGGVQDELQVTRCPSAQILLRARTAARMAWLFLPVLVSCITFKIEGWRLRD